MADVSEFIIRREIVEYDCEINIMSLEWWQKNVIYHIYLPSFKDSNNDGFGDFEGLTSKLTYIEGLGIKTLQLSPFYPSPMKDNGYDISSYIDIDPIYGSMEDFNNFMTEVKKRDMNVFVDLVANHTSDQHPWFQKSILKMEPYSDFYIWVDEKEGSTYKNKLPPNNWLSVFGGPAWTWNKERKQFYLHQFLPEQPDLNFRNPAVIEEMKNIMRFWLEKGVDGFRIDAASHLLEDEHLRDEPVSNKSGASENEHAHLEHIYTKGLKENTVLLKKFRAVLDEYGEKSGKPKIMVTEAFEDVKEVMKYYGAVGDKIANFTFNFQLYKVKATSTGIDLFEKVDSWLKNMPKGKYPNWVLSSHDDPRMITRFGCRLASSLQMMIMLLPGIPICYYGDELGMENGILELKDIKDSFALRTRPENSRDPMRTPMQWNSDKNAGFTDCDKPWLPIHENYETINVEVEENDPQSFLSLFKCLVKFRDEPSILTGLLVFPLLNEDIFSFFRFLVGAKCYLLVINMSSKCIQVDLTHTCRYLPTEAYLELSNGHVQETHIDFRVDVLASNEIKSTPNKCKCQHNSKMVRCASAATSETKDIKISLSDIHLKAKEAIILTFIGELK